jgi:hypothetical protein
MKSLTERRDETLAQAAEMREAGWDAIAADSLLEASFYTENPSQARALHLTRAKFYSARGLNAEATAAYECAISASQDMGTAAEADAHRLKAKHFVENGYRSEAIIYVHRVLGMLAACPPEPGLKKVQRQLMASARKWEAAEDQSGSEVTSNNRLYGTARRLGQSLAALYPL